MGATKKKDKKTQGVSLPSVLDIRSAKSFYDEMKGVSKAGTNLEIDAENVEKITTPAIQILLAACVAVSKKKGSFKIKNSSPEMEKAFVTMGLQSQFNEWK